MLMKNSHINEYWQLRTSIVYNWPVNFSVWFWLHPLTSYCSNNCSTVRMYTLVRCLLSLFSNIPRHRPNLPTTPASSSASLAADISGSSSGFTFPPGIIHICGLADDETSSTSLSLESFYNAKDKHQIQVQIIKLDFLYNCPTRWPMWTAKASRWLN